MGFSVIGLGANGMKRYVCSECYQELPEQLRDKSRLCSQECRSKQEKRTTRADYYKPLKSQKAPKIQKKHQQCAEKIEALESQVAQLKHLIALEKKKANDAVRASFGIRPDAFFDSREWQVLRYKALKVYGHECALCGAGHGPMHVDHIKPRSKYPELALVFENLQVLCKACNFGKGAWDESNWKRD